MIEILDLFGNRGERLAYHNVRLISLGQRDKQVRLLNFYLQLHAVSLLVLHPLRLNQLVANYHQLLVAVHEDVKLSQDKYFLGIVRSSEFEE
jgi:hypothetical protein